MADLETKRISELIAAQDIGDSDLFVIEQGGAAKKALGSVVKGAIGGSSLPPGGTPGQVLTKTADGTKWDDVSGLPDGGSNGQVLTKTSSGATWSDAGTPTQAQTNTALADYLDEHPEVVTNIPDRIKQALLACFQKVAWIDAHGQDYYDALYSALMNKVVLSISAVFTQGSAVIYDTDDLDVLREYLVVTASYDDGTTGEVTDYSLSGTLAVGTSTITVDYYGKTDTFDVTVSEFILNDILTLDGIKNSRSGHNASATTWEDLSGNGHDFAATSDSTIVWGNDHAAFDATKRLLKCVADLQGTGNKLTIEFVVKNDGDGSLAVTSTAHQGMILANTENWNDVNGQFKFYSYRDSASNGMSTRYGSLNTGYVSGLGSIKYIAFVYDGTNITRYSNAVASTSVVTGAYPSGTKSSNWVIGGGNNSVGYFNGKIYRIGISAKAMTSEEIAERFAFFADRFGIE